MTDLTPPKIDADPGWKTIPFFASAKGTPFFSRDQESDRVLLRNGDRMSGDLLRVDEGWRLKVARTGYDVLLDRLPWGIGFVLLPWMKQPLYVEW